VRYIQFGAKQLLRAIEEDTKLNIQYRFQSQTKPHSNRTLVFEKRRSHKIRHVCRKANAPSQNMDIIWTTIFEWHALVILWRQEQIPAPMEGSGPASIDENVKFGGKTTESRTARKSQNIRK
jgi:hypothetical protein